MVSARLPALPPAALLLFCMFKKGLTKYASGKHIIQFKLQW